MSDNCIAAHHHPLCMYAWTCFLTDLRSTCRAHSGHTMTQLSALLALHYGPYPNWDDSGEHARYCIRDYHYPRCLQSKHGTRHIRSVVFFAAVHHTTVTNLKCNEPSRRLAHNSHHHPTNSFLHDTHNVSIDIRDNKKCLTIIKSTDSQKCIYSRYNRLTVNVEFKNGIEADAYKIRSSFNYFESHRFFLEISVL